MTEQQHNHAVVWIDHLKARIFLLGLTGVESKVVNSHLRSNHLHHKTNSMGSGRAPEDTKYLEEVWAAVNSAGEILVIGPGKEKDVLVAHVRESHSKDAARIAGVKTVDHPTDKEIVALARHHFGLDRATARA